MRLTALLLVATCLHVSAHVKGQDDRVTYSGNNVPLEQVFTAVRKQTSYLFLYNDALLAGARKVTVNVKNASVEEVMSLCAQGQPFAYSIKNKMIYIINKEISSASAKPTSLNHDPAKDVKGRVMNSNGEPVAGATIKVKETGATIMASENGEFELTGLENNNILIISSVGHETLQIKFTGTHYVSIVLKQITAPMEELVIKGYYTTTKKLNTGNVTKVKGEDIMKQPVTDPILALQGRVPGLYISQTSGVPGSNSKIQLRGQNSIANGNTPLYIVDGVPSTASTLTLSYIGGGITGTPPAPGLPDNGQGAGLSPFNNLNPADIESIEVLKDADATAIYGSRGANGVILITTKKGKVGKTKFDLNAYTGNGQIGHMIPMLNTQQYLAMRREAFANDGKTPSNSDLDLNGTWDTTSYTNWQKVLIGGISHFTNAQASLTGGNSNTQFFITSGISKQTAVYPGNFADKKASLNFNINHTSNDRKFHSLLSGGYVKDNNQLPMVDYSSSIAIAPNAPSNLVDAYGNLNWSYPFGNPFAFLKRIMKAVTYNLTSNISIDYELIPGLQVKSNLGYTHVIYNQTNINPASSNKPPNDANPSYRLNTWGTNDLETWIIEPQINYTTKIRQGKIDVLVGSTFQENNQKAIGQEASGFISDDLIQNVSLAPSVAIRGNKAIKYHYNAIYGRFGYNWKEKYLINLTARRDGSSRFGSGKQFGNFGAAGAAWIFSQEKFIRNSLPFLSFGKLRASYGITGNDQLTDYQYLSMYEGYTTSYYQNIVGLYPTQLANPLYGWETVKKWEGGIELGFLNDRILISANYYRNRTNNQLVGYALPVTTGFATILANLPAVIQNSGVELALNTINIKNSKISWSSAFNISIPRNKLVSYPGLSSSSYKSKYQEGKPLSIKYLYHATGVDPNSGVYTIEDIDNSGTINSSDNQFIKKITQNYYGGFQNSVSYKGFQLDFLFQFVKQTANNYSKNFTIPGFYNSGSGNQPTYTLNRWQKQGDNVFVQKYTQQTGATQQGWTNGVANGDYAITDASFIRLKNVSISYQLPIAWLKVAHLNNFSIYTLAQNIFTITNYQGMDPETQGIVLPPLRIITFGVRVSI